MTPIRSKHIARTAGIALLSLAGVALAQPGPPPGGPMGPGAGPMMGPGAQRMQRHHDGRGFGPGRAMAALNLTEDQRNQIARIREDTRKDSWNTAGQLMTERFAMRQILRAERIDSNAAVQQQAKVDELERQLLKARLDARNRITALLSPDQQRIFRQMPMFERRGGPGMRRGMASEGGERDESFAGEVPTEAH